MNDSKVSQLGPICCVTITVPNLEAVESCYTAYLDHSVIGRGTVGEELAQLWQAPAVATSHYLLLSPAAGDDCVLRFVETDADADYVPFSTYGWNAAEIMVDGDQHYCVREREQFSDLIRGESLLP